MSELSATQIPKPTDDVAFERCNEVLWRCILKDDTAQLHGRRGQRQHGVDIVGRRNGALDQVVGIQCKLRGEGVALEPAEVRQEVDKALSFEPLLAEYIIATTAPDDAKLQRLALELSESISKRREKRLKIGIFGWNSLEREIRRYPEALNAFDPSHTPSAERIEQAIQRVPQETVAALQPSLDAFGNAIVQTIRSATEAPVVHSEYDRQIAVYSELITTDPNTAIGLFRNLAESVGSEVPKGIRFKIAANIASCQLELGEREAAARAFVAACALDPDNPKAAASKAFGLLLQKDWNTLRTFGEDRLREHQDNSAVAACYIHSLIGDVTITDPLKHVPEAVHRTPEVAEAHVRWLMERGQHGAWWGAAIAAHRMHPDSIRLRELRACALLERVVDRGGIDHPLILTEAQRGDVQKSKAFYEERWREISGCSGHVSGDPVSTTMNLMSAHRLLDEDQLAIQIGCDAVARFPDSVALKKRLATALAEHGETKRALDLISELPMDPEIAAIRYNISMSDGDWQSLGVIAEESIEQFPEGERGIVRAGGIVAKVEVASEQNRRSILEAEQGQFIGDARALATLAECARKHGFDDLSSAYFAAAQTAFENGDSTFASRRSLAIEAMGQGRPDTAADVLDGHVVIDGDSSEVRLLARVLANDYPIRERAVRFFSRLPREVRDLAFFRCMEGVFQFNRGVPEKAIAPFESVFEDEPSIVNLMYLVRAQLAVGDRSGAAALLREQGVETLLGSPSERMGLCTLLVEFADSARALELGYQALVEGLEDANVVMEFLRLVLDCPEWGSDGEVDDPVGPGSWVQLTDSRGGAFEVVVGETVDRPWGAKGDPTNPFVGKALGRKTGDSFEFANPVTGATETWTVAETRPRWLQAFHHLSATFNQTYPAAGAFGSVPIDNGEIQPVLDLVRRRSDEARVQANDYLEKDLPMEFVARNWPGGSIEFARYVVSIGKEVRVCVGTEGERAEALALIDRHGGTGAVLDGFTAWHASGLGVLDVLRERLGTLAIPASELNRLKVMVRDRESVVGKAPMSLGYRDGRYVRQFASADRQAEQLALMKSRIKEIEEACEVEPVVVPDNLSELGERLVRRPMGDTMVPGVIAGTDRLLLSEDLMMRQLADKGYGTNGVWLQAVLLSSVVAGKMSVDDYVDAVGDLAALRHSHVALDTQVLVRTYERDRSDTFVRLRALCTYIGNKNADLVSHVKIAADFVNLVWSRSSNDDRVRNASDVIMGALVDREGDDERARWAAACYERLTDGPRAYFVDWCRVHNVQLET